MNSITSKDLFNIFLKNILIIIISAIVFAGSAFVYCENFTDKKFKAQGEIIVSNGALGSQGTGETETDSTESNTDGTTSDTDKVLNTDVAASINLLPTIRSTLKRDGIYKEFAAYLKENSNYTYSWSRLKAAATVEQTEERSLYFSISFELNTREDAIAITNHFLSFAPSYIEGKILGCRAEADPACDTAVQTAPRTSSTVFIASIVGALLCYAIVFLITILNSTIKSDEDFSSRYNIPVIGNIPDFSISHTNGKPSPKKGTGGKKNG